MAKKYPYEARITELHRTHGTEVTIDRRDAPSLKGKVDELEDEGFYLESSEGVELGMMKRIFIAFEDVRGVTMTHDDVRDHF